MKIVLRELKREDGRLISEWRNSPLILSNCIDQSLITEESFEKYFKENIETGKYRQYMVERYDEEMPFYCYAIGSMFLRNIDIINKKCELGILPSTDFEWNEEGKAIALRLLTEKVFREFRFHKIYSYMFSDAGEEIKLFESVGYMEEARLEEEILVKNGIYRSLVRMKVCNDF